MDLGNLRNDYDTEGLDANALGDDPLAAIAAWLDQAIRAEVPQANAMSVATVTGEGRPSVRTVLLKGIDRGLVFYTNYGSAKAGDIEATGVAAASLTWVQLHRQVRASGDVERVSPELSDAYFATRPRGAQLAAAASAQSEVLEDRADLERRMTQLDAQYPDVVPRPEHWGGYRIIPTRIEFWQGRRNRMHDRIVFHGSADSWSTTRLWP